MDDRGQGWRARFGDIQRELLHDAAEGGDKRLFDDYAKNGPVWGLHFTKRF